MEVYHSVSLFELCGAADLNETCSDKLHAVVGQHIGLFILLLVSVVVHSFKFMSLQLADEAESLVLDKVQMSAFFPSFLLISCLNIFGVSLLERFEEHRLLLLYRTKLILQGTELHDGFVTW